MKPLISQFVLSAISIGANYCQADGVETPRDFRQQIALCRKESRETMHCCRMIARACPAQKTVIRAFWKEAEELISAIFRKTNPSHT